MDPVRFLIDAGPSWNAVPRGVQTARTRPGAGAAGSEDPPCAPQRGARRPDDVTRRATPESPPDGGRHLRRPEGTVHGRPSRHRPRTSEPRHHHDDDGIRPSRHQCQNGGALTGNCL